MIYVLNADIELRQGSDYLDIDNRSVTFVGDGVCWDSSLVDVTLKIKSHQNTCNTVQAQELAIAGVYSAPSSGAAGVCKFDITNTQTLALTKGVRAYSYSVVGETSNNTFLTLANGLVTVL